MDDLQSEKEQIEEMRAWWSEYGKVVVAGIVIGVAGLVGYNQYNSNQLTTQVEASERFETLVTHVVDGDVDDAEFVADDLAANYADTIYAAQSKLALARLYMDQNRDQDAADTLRELLDMSADKNLQSIGRLRLANVLLYQEKPEEVVELLEGSESEAFAGLTNETLGDAYTALGEYDKARDAYNAALLDPSPSQTVDRGLVQMKLTDLPQVAVAEADAAAAATESVDETSTEDAVEDDAVEAAQPEEAAAEDEATE